MHRTVPSYPPPVKRQTPPQRLKEFIHTVRKLDVSHLCFSLNFLFSYVSSQFPSMFVLPTYSQSFFSLSVDYPKTLKTKEKQDSIQLIQEQSKILFYNLRISQDSQTDHWIQW